MNYYLAPMEGITTYLFRNAYHRYFGGADKYFTPFITSRNMNQRERNEVLPEHNQGLDVVPQILTNRADEFLAIAGRIAEYGYTTVNLNLGCPSGTVTAKKRGAGFLGVPDELDRFLYEIYENPPLKISIKTRIGVSSVEEWGGILERYRKYPIEELIIHPRLQKEMYRYTPHWDAFQAACDVLSVPLCYNGDITSRHDLEGLLAEMPQIGCVMAGRGVLKNPALIAELKGADRGEVLTKEALRAFHDELFEGYAAIMPGETPALFKMKDLWSYLSGSFADSGKYLKKRRKAGTFRAYKIAVDTLFRECRL